VGVSNCGTFLSLKNEDEVEATFWRNAEAHDEDMKMLVD